MRLVRLNFWTAIGITLPCASWALGLGDIQVQSALGQPLSAQINIVGATAEDLARLRATIADDQTFQHHGLERLSFLSSTVMSVGHDAQQRPVLLLRSSESFNEPAITFLVDVHSPSGELIREYTILLDPPGLARSNVIEGAAVVEAVSTSPADASQSSRPSSLLLPSAHAAASTAGIKLAGDTYKVAAHDTLDRIVRVAGAHTRSDRHRMMVAIFRTNPQAFQNNLNVLHSGVTLHLPSAAELSSITTDEADREVAAQMSAWQPGRRRQAATAPVAAQTIDHPMSAGADAVADTGATPIKADSHADADSAAEAAKIAALKERLARAEKSLAQVQQELARPMVVPAAPMAATPDVAPEASAPVAATATAGAIATAPALRPAAPVRAAVAMALPANAASAPFFTPELRLALLGTGLGVALAAGVWLYRRRRGKDLVAPPTDTQARQDLPLHRRRFRVKSVEAIAEALSATSTSQQLSVDVPSAAKESKSAAKVADRRSAHDKVEHFEESDSVIERNLLFDAATVELKLDFSGFEDTVAGTADTAIMPPRTEARRHALDPDNLFNPEATINTTHVTLTSELSEESPFAERRKNPADVLRQAIEREPERSDLRLKLLELYYVAATQNQRAFLEVAREIANNQKLASAKEWAQIVDMGRKIAPNDKLFSNEDDDQAVA